MNFVPTNDLNNAKQKISYLLRMKYVENNNEYTPNKVDGNINTQFMEVINLLNKANSAVIQMTTLVTKTLPKKPNDPMKGYFRGAGAYASFIQLALNVDNSIKHINKKLLDLMNNVKYVKPENIQLFYAEIDKYKQAFIAFFKYFFTPPEEKKFIPYKYSSGDNTPLRTSVELNEMEQINNIFNSIKNENNTLHKFKETITNMYNYQDNASININRKNNKNSFSDIESKKLFFDIDYDN